MATSSRFRILKTSVIITGVLLALLVLTALLLPRLLDTLGIKQRLTEMASQATGLKVLIEGDLQFGFFPGLEVIANDVQFVADGENIAAVQTLGLGIALLPLLQKEIRINRIMMQEPQIAFTRNADGEFNFSWPEFDAKTLSPQKLERISVVNGTVRYSDARDNSKYAARDCNILADNLLLTASNLEEKFAHTGFTAELACAELRHNDFIISNSHITAVGDRGALMLDPITMTVFGAAGSASLHMDFTGESPQHALNLVLPQFRIGAFLDNLGVQQAAEGAMDFNAMLTMQGSSLAEISQSMSGQLSLQGQQLVVYGVDIDKEISRIESSQNFNLVDVGAFFFAGPLGLVVTKGYDFVNVLQGTETRSEIQALVSDWTMTAGVAQAQDVAMVTAESRLALQGGLDFPDGQFNDVTFAIVDAEGCASFMQVINGSFQNPEVKDSGILRSLAGPVISLLQEGIDLVSDEECEPFYTGSLTAPQ